MNSEEKQILLDLKKGQEKLFKGQDELFKGQEKLFESQEKLFDGQEKLSKGQEEIKSDLRNLSQTVAKIEVDHGQKLEILLDVVTSLPQKFESTEKTLDKHEKKLNKHSDEIYYLNSKVQAF